MTRANEHQRVTIAKKYFNNQEDRITHSIDTSQSPSPAITVITQWTHE